MLTRIAPRSLLRLGRPGGPGGGRCGRWPPASGRPDRRRAALARNRCGCSPPRPAARLLVAAPDPPRGPPVVAPLRLLHLEGAVLGGFAKALQPLLTGEDEA